MKKASLLRTQRRMLALCALSLLLHLLALEWIATRLGSRPPPVEESARMVISARLRAPVEAAMPAAAPPAAAAAAPARPAPSAAAPAPAPAAPKPQADPEPETDQLPMSPQPGLRMRQPRNYHTRIPPSAVVTFDVSRSDAGAPPRAAGTASIDWRTDGSSYSLRMEGVPDQGAFWSDTVTLTSAGGFDDVGIAPRVDGKALGAGAQDRASLLIQLAAMGLADPDQFNGILVFQVGSGEDAALVQFEVIGTVRLATPLGALETVHLAQLVRPGESRLEVWLAAAHNWYPVRLRTTWPDGAVATQLVRRIAPAGAP